MTVKTNVLRAATIAATAMLCMPSQAATVTSTSDIVVGDPTHTYGVALLDIGNPAADYTIGYEFILRIPDALKLVQIATSGGSQIVASNAPNGAPAPVPGTPPSGLTAIGVNSSSNLNLSSASPGTTVYVSVAATAYFIDTLQLAFLSMTPGLHTVEVAGFSEGYYDYPASVAISTQDIDVSFAIGVTDPSIPTVPLPAALPLLLAGLGSLAFAGRWRKG